MIAFDVVGKIDVAQSTDFFSQLGGDRQAATASFILIVDSVVSTMVPMCCSPLRRSAKRCAFGLIIECGAYDYEWKHERSEIVQDGVSQGSEVSLSTIRV